MRGNFIYYRLGRRIVKGRKRKGFSQEVLSMLTDIDRTYLGRLEQGKANPSFKILAKLARALRIRLSELLEDI